MKISVIYVIATDDSDDLRYLSVVKGSVSREEHALLAKKYHCIPEWEYGEEPVDGRTEFDLDKDYRIMYIHECEIEHTIQDLLNDHH